MTLSDVESRNESGTFGVFFPEIFVDEGKEVVNSVLRKRCKPLKTHIHATCWCIDIERCKSWLILLVNQSTFHLSREQSCPLRVILDE